MKEEKVTARFVHDIALDQFKVSSPCPFCKDTIRFYFNASNMYLRGGAGGCDHLGGYSIGSTEGTAIEHQQFTFIYREDS